MENMTESNIASGVRSTRGGKRGEGSQEGGGDLKGEREEKTRQTKESVELVKSLSQARQKKESAWGEEGYFKGTPVFAYGRDRG